MAKWGWPLFAGLLTTGWMIVYFKLFLAPPNRDILVSLTPTELTFFNFKSLKIIFSFIAGELIDKRWGFIWIFIIGLMVLNIRRVFIKENAVLSLFFLCYFIIIILVYLTTVNFDMTWRLKSTLFRIFFYLLPSFLFFSFKLIKTPNTQTPSSADANV